MDMDMEKQSKGQMEGVAFANYWAQLESGIQNGDPTVIGILVAVMVVLLTIVLFTCRRGSNKRRGVLLVGLCDSGKTLLFSQLVYGQHKKSQTSIKENDGSYKLAGKKKGTLRVIDIPGHERIRGQIIDEYKPMARGLLFVIDSHTFLKEIKDVAEYLYTLLTDKVITSHAPPVLIACNKQDVTLAKGAKVIQSQLEKEINTVRVTRSGQLMGTDGGSSQAFLGRKGKDFTFSDLKPFQVEFVECSARGSKLETDGGDLTQVQEWLHTIA